MRVELLEAGRVPAMITFARALAAEQRVARLGPHSCASRNILYKTTPTIYRPPIPAD